MYVLGIETSCDETGIAVFESSSGLLAHKVHSQIETHKVYGGVIPELASRDHIRWIDPLVKETLKTAGINIRTLSGIGYTAGPGLLGALLVGSSYGRSLGFFLGIPSLGIHHMEGHLLSPVMENSAITPPFMALLVSGGHTELVYVLRAGQYHRIGYTLDDAAGEAFDKIAKLLGLGYPGGPKLSRLAEKGNSERFRFSRPMTDKPGFNFSFSGLKTQVVMKARSLNQQNMLNEQAKADIAAGFEAAVVDTLIIKCRRSLQVTMCKQLVVSGGVSANSNLRKQLILLEKEGINIAFPSLEFCTDNGAMIAYAAHERLRKGQNNNSLEINVKPRWLLDEL